MLHSPTGCYKFVIYYSMYDLSRVTLILVSLMEPRLVLRVYYMCSITVHIMRGGGGASVGSDMNSPLPPLLGFRSKHLNKVYI